MEKGRRREQREGGGEDREGGEGGRRKGGGHTSNVLSFLSDEIPFGIFFKSLLFI
jgi:hypothetical protein